MRPGELAKKTKKLLFAIGRSIEEGIDEMYAQERFVRRSMPGERGAVRAWRKVMRRLVYVGYLRKTKGGFFILTEKGLAVTRVHESKRKKWDRKWRILIFDIPEKQKNIRDSLRKFLQRFYFIQLQKSVWVLPYEVPKEIDQYLRDNHILEHTRYIVATYIDRYQDLLKHFGLGK